LIELQQITKGQLIFTDLPELKKAFVSLTTSTTPGLFKLNDYLNQITALFDQQLDQISKAELEWAPIN
jgi:hypothetical protein